METYVVFLEIIHEWKILHMGLSENMVLPNLMVHHHVPYATVGAYPIFRHIHFDNL